MGAPLIVLLDNGSLRPAAVRALRATAQALAARIGREVVPVSLLHSHKIAAAELDGVPAPVIEPWLKVQTEAGMREFLVVPYFLGPSRALTEYLPARVAKLRMSWPDLMVRVAEPLGAGGEGAVDQLAAVLEERVRAELARVAGGDERPAVAMVDHGSPEPRVTAVRDAVAERLQARLGAAVRAVAACSMERREGEEFAFSDPLLAALLDRAPYDRGTVIVAMLFLSPGRHAGPEGDVAVICREAQVRHSGLQVTMTELLGGHPVLVAMLAERLEAALSGGSESGPL
ncbi:MAG: cobalamin biosynthesis protein CbiX [Opitutaceae bacterium]|nr:cobalamin biosynthesis protein CbiX [Opitutaceae bacterium]